MIRQHDNLKVDELENAMNESMKDNNSNEINNKRKKENNTNEQNNEYLVNATITRFLPFMMMYMMMIDNNSILNSRTFGIKNNNTLWAWGKNDNGQLGTNDVVHRSSPTQIGSVTTDGYFSVRFE